MFGQLSPDLPQQQYAELVRSRAQQRLAHRIVADRKAARTLARRSSRLPLRPGPNEAALATPAPSAC